MCVVMTQKDFVVFTEESTSLLQRHQRMLVDSCLFIGGLGHTQIELLSSKHCMYCEREMLLS